MSRWPFMQAGFLISLDDQIAHHDPLSRNNKTRLVRHAGPLHRFTPSARPTSSWPGGFQHYSYPAAAKQVPYVVAAVEATITAAFHTVEGTSVANPSRCPKAVTDHTEVGSHKAMWQGESELCVHTLSKDALVGINVG